MGKTVITEFDDMDPDTVHLVGKGANGFPVLLAKAVAEVEIAKEATDSDDKPKDCPTCHGDGKIMDGHRKCPDCNGTGVMSDDAAKGALIAKAYDDLVKGKYNAKEMEGLKSKGRTIDNAQGKPSFPIDDVSDLKNAVAAVGRGSADHDAIRRHIMKHADRLGAKDKVPGNWNSDGSLKDDADKGDDGDAAKSAPGGKAWEDNDASRLDKALGLLEQLKKLLTDAEASEEEEAATATVKAALVKMAGEFAGSETGGVTKAELEEMFDSMFDARVAKGAKDGAADGSEDEEDSKDNDDDAEAKPHNADADDDDVSKSAVQEQFAKQVVEQVKDVVGDVVKAALAGMEDRLSTVEKSAKPGGPTKTRPPAALVKSERRDALDIAEADFRRKADTTTDTDLRGAYLAKAKAVVAERAALTD